MSVFSIISNILSTSLISPLSACIERSYTRFMAISWLSMLVALWYIHLYCYSNYYVMTFNRKDGTIMGGGWGLGSPS